MYIRTLSSRSYCCYSFVDFFLLCCNLFLKWIYRLNSQYCHHAAIMHVISGVSPVNLSPSTMTKSTVCTGLWEVEWSRNVGRHDVGSAQSRRAEGNGRQPARASPARLLCKFLMSGTRAVYYDSYLYAVVFITLAKPHFDLKHKQEMTGLLRIHVYICVSQLSCKNLFAHCLFIQSHGLSCCRRRTRRTPWRRSGVDSCCRTTWSAINKTWSEKSNQKKVESTSV